MGGRRGASGAVQCLIERGADIKARSNPPRADADRRSARRAIRGSSGRPGSGAGGGQCADLDRAERPVRPARRRRRRPHSRLRSAAAAAARRTGGGAGPQRRRRGGGAAAGGCSASARSRSANDDDGRRRRTGPGGAQQMAASSRRCRMRPARTISSRRRFCWRRERT